MAGYVTAEQDFDRDGVDIQIRAGGHQRPSLDIQLKATTSVPSHTIDEFRYPLKRRNYDLLIEQTIIPRILAVLMMPNEEAEWLEVTPEQLIMRKCCYWVCLTGLPFKENNTSITVGIPKNNVLDIDALKMLMDRARTGEIQ